MYKIVGQRKYTNKNSYYGEWSAEKGMFITYEQAIIYPGAAYVPDKGYVVLDADGKQAIEFVDTIISYLPQPPISYPSCGSKGKHYVFKTPPGWENRLTTNIGVSPLQLNSKHQQIDLKGNTKGLLYFKKQHNKKPVITKEALDLAFEQAPVLPMIFCINSKGWKNYDGTTRKLSFDDVPQGEWNNKATWLYSTCKNNNFSKSETQELATHWLQYTKRDVALHMKEFNRDFDKAYSTTARKINPWEFTTINNKKYINWKDGFKYTYKTINDTHQGKVKYYQVTDILNYDIIAQHIINTLQLQKTHQDYQIWGYEKDFFKPIEYFDDLIKKFLIDELVELHPKIFANLINYIQASIPIKKMINNEFIVSFKNIHYDVLKGEVVNLPDNTMNYNYIPHNLILDTNQFLKKDQTFLQKVMTKWSKNEPEIEKELYELIGQAMTRYMKRDKSFFLLGPGSNGKSLFLEFVSIIFGKYNVSNVDIQEIANDKFAVADLYGKTININADISATIIANPSLFKKITSGDYLRGQHKNQKSFSFKPYATQVYACNEVPMAKERGDNDGFTRRLKIIPFNNIFVEKSHKKMIELTTKLHSTTIIELAIAKAVEAIHRALNTGFTESAVSLAIYDEHIKDMNNVRLFIEEYPFRHNTEVLQVYEAYIKWTKANHQKSYSLNNFKNKFINAMRNDKNIKIFIYPVPGGKERFLSEKETVG